LQARTQGHIFRSAGQRAQIRTETSFSLKSNKIYTITEVIALPPSFDWKLKIVHVSRVQKPTKDTKSGKAKQNGKEELRKAQKQSKSSKSTLPSKLTPP
jgi:hypothetical protein